MAVNSVSGGSSYVKASYANNGVSGLASGMDTDSLVEQMLAGTQKKIDAQNAKKTQLGWKQDIYRDIIKEIQGLQNKYFHSGSYLSSVSPFALNSEELWNAINSISSSSAVSVSAGKNAPTGTTTVNVAQLASNTSAKSMDSVSGTLRSQTAIDIGTRTDTMKLDVQMDSAIKTIEVDLAAVKQAAIDNSTTNEEELKNAIQTEVNKAHGFGSISVSLDSISNKLSFNTTDKGRSLSITGSEADRKVIGVRQGESSKIAYGMELESIGFTGNNPLVAGDIGTEIPADQGYGFEINGHKFEFAKGTTIGAMMEKINASEIGVKIQYLDMEDKFSIERTETGKGFDIDMKDTSGNLLGKMFGNDTPPPANPPGTTITADKTMGQNAVVQINGVWTERNTNTFTNNDMTFTLADTTGKFDYVAAGFTYDRTTGEYKNSSGDVKSAKEVAEASGAFQAAGTAQIKTTRDTERIFDALTGFVNDYNKLTEKLNDLVGEKKTYKDYPPLSDAQKKEMSDKEIEAWEEKAKEGLLRGDADISSLLYSMRSALYSKPDGSDIGLYNIGIETSTDSKENGKLIIDEAKLRAAIESKLPQIKELFTAEAFSEDGSLPNSKKGIGRMLDEALKGAVSEKSLDNNAWEGSLVQKAGIKGKGSEKQNDTTKSIDKSTDLIKDLKRKYEKEKQRYWRQFNAMEQAISNMNSQSSWLAQQFG